MTDEATKGVVPMLSTAHLLKGARFTDHSEDVVLNALAAQGIELIHAPRPDEVASQAPTPTAEDSISGVLAERGTRYGAFIGHSEICQDLKATIKLHLDNRAKVLHWDQQEALDMICHKIARIINGDADYADSWVDIAGYAKLVADRLEAPNAGI